MKKKILFIILFSILLLLIACLGIKSFFAKSNSSLSNEEKRQIIINNTNKIVLNAKNDVDDWKNLGEIYSDDFREIINIISKLENIKGIPVCSASGAPNRNVYKFIFYDDEEEIGDFIVSSKLSLSGKAAELDQEYQNELYKIIENYVLNKYGTIECSNNINDIYTSEYYMLFDGKVRSYYYFKTGSMSERTFNALYKKYSFRDNESKWLKSFVQFGINEKDNTYILDDELYNKLDFNKLEYESLTVLLYTDELTDVEILKYFNKDRESFINLNVEDLLDCTYSVW